MLNMKLHVLLVVSVLAILMINLVSAFEFDNALSFDKTKGAYGKAIVKNAFGLGDTLAEVELKTNTMNCSNDCSAIGNLTLYTSGKLIEDIRFEGGRVNSYKFYLSQGIKEVEVTKDKQECSGTREELNGTITKTDCKSVGYTTTEMQEVWEEYTGEELPAGTYTWKITGDKPYYETVDWIAKWQGVEVTQWITWGSTNEGVKIYSYNAGTPDIGGCGGSNRWCGTNFTAEASGTITNISVRIYRDVGVTGTWHVMLRNIDPATGKPVINTNLSVGYLDISTLPTADDGVFKNISITVSPYAIVSGTTYAWVASSLDGSATSAVRFYVDTDNADPKTNGYISTDNGVSFAQQGWDMLFYVYGANIISGGNLTVNLSAPAHLTNYPSSTSTVKLNASFYSNAWSFINTTFWVWNNGTGEVYNITKNSTINTAVNVSSFYLTSLPTGTYKWNALVCGSNSSAGMACDWAGTNWTFSINSFTENSQTYNQTTFETATENYAINFTYDSTAYTSATAILYYNGTGYSGTRLGTGGEAVFYKSSLDIPLTSTAIGKNFFWSIALTNSTGGYYTNTTTKIQNVSAIYLSLCNSSLSTAFVNFTFKDESTNTNLSAATDLSSWNYWLGSGAINKTLLFSNSTANPSYGFCFSPNNRTVKGDVTYQYSQTGYPQRSSTISFTYTNITTNQTFYLLSTADGIYTTFVARDTEGNIVEGMTVVAEREISGVWTTIAQGTTDAAGSVTFWLNPNYDQRFTFTKTTCEYQFTLKPTQTSYTITIPCAGTTNNAYISPIEGIQYRREPDAGILQEGMQTFTYWVYSSKGNIVRAKFELFYTANKTVISSNETTNCATSCTLNLNYNVTYGDDFKGRYYVDIGTGYLLLEGDARWLHIFINQTGTTSSLKSFFDTFKDFYNEWGEDPHECSSKYNEFSGAGYGPPYAAWNASCSADVYCRFVGGGTGEAYMCIPSDLQNKQEFSRIVAFFLVFCILFTIFGKFTGYDALNPGLMISALTAIVVFMSAVGGKSGEGYFYYDGLTSIHFINNYFLASILIIYTVGYWVNLQRRQG